MCEFGWCIGFLVFVVIEWVWCLEEVGVVLGYGVCVVVKLLGCVISVFIGVKDLGCNDLVFVCWVRECDGVLECYLVIGDNFCMFKVVVVDVVELEVLFGELIDLGFICDMFIVFSMFLEGKLLLFL